MAEKTNDAARNKAPSAMSFWAILSALIQDIQNSEEVHGFQETSYWKSLTILALWIAPKVPSTLVHFLCLCNGVLLDD